MLNNYKRVHFVGLGGIGMSGLAQVLNWRGFVVSGSDSTPSALLDRLAKDGITVFIGHEANNAIGAEVLVVSSAIAKTNPEVMYAREHNLPVLHRSDVLADIMAQKQSIAVAGAHGKTTTTALLGMCLKYADMQPTVVVGGIVSSLNNNNVILGDGAYCVAEADESDGSFLKLPKEIVVVTNIEDDHMEHYKTMDNMLKAFRQFLSTLDANGCAVLCADDHHVMSVQDSANCPKLFYSLTDSTRDYFANNIDLTGGRPQFDIYERGNLLGRVTLGVPGLYNIANCLAAFAVARFLGADFEVLKIAAADFRGANRRFQIKGEKAGVLVVDDYAHHPTEIAATLKAAQEIGRKRVVCCFQPHRFSRTALLKTEFGKCFNDADLMVFADIYSASEDVIPGIDGMTIPSEYAKNNDKEYTFLKDYKDIPEKLAQLVRPGDILITMGAGNITAIGDKVLELL